ncbi:flagellar protein FlgN [Clostridium sp. WLY-B-L2]|uniref:Flagellar protein FlgN n=1 Tax=Clostridium aromativorans TaxID=2836848 RepID=A0ABS8N260_9CLOT|nr:MULTISPECIES: flagellar export chaperone FlgN [Clostridium]KAA8678163.1 flagellar protein FlgN [Clostridium sp. HV4-5-A1G]MCC9293887.1 flagellar protein FlgN [Clostridium aromativorans]CAB1241561.1 FlgN protein [Clostridiaceae bacterium BL-3]
MSLQLMNIMENEYSVLKELLKALEDQNQYLLKREVFKLDKIVKVLEEKSKTVAFWEVERRKITDKRPMREVIAESKDENMKKTYENIVELLRKMQLQKDTNEALIKQWLVFTNQMLRALNPARKAVTYNALGKSR